MRPRKRRRLRSRRPRWDGGRFADSCWQASIAAGCKAGLGRAMEATPGPMVFVLALLVGGAVELIHARWLAGPTVGSALLCRRPMLLPAALAPRRRNERAMRLGMGGIALAGMQPRGPRQLPSAVASALQQAAQTMACLPTMDEQLISAYSFHQLSSHCLILQVGRHARSTFGGHGRAK